MYWEDEIQKACMQYLDVLSKTHDLWAFHVPNGGKRGKIEAARFRGLGVKPGVADIVILWRQDGQPELGFIEVKTLQGRQSKSQKDFQRIVEDIGWPYAIVRGVDDLQEVLDEWGVIDLRDAA